MAKTSKLNPGFTLIELLLSISLLSLLMLTGLYAYDYMQQNWRRNQNAITQVREEFVNMQLLDHVLANTYPKLIYQKNPAVPDVSQANPIGFYFLGREEGFTAVSGKSFQDPESATVYRLFREPDPVNKNRFQLVYEEALTRITALTFADQNLPFSFRRILLSNQSEIVFRYRGWLSLSERLQSNTAGAVTFFEEPWQELYDGMQTFQHPVQISLVTTDLSITWYVADQSPELLRQID
jgi:prepilin-type N-terminal cleavage/methylation domain-containing protein